jgi:hypothetical protein
LELIHAAGILHGNLRLENLLVTDMGDVTIIDFNQGWNDASENELREEYALLYDMLHRMIDENEKEATGSIESGVVGTTKGTLTMTLTEAPPLRFTTLDRAMEPEKLSRISDPDTGGNMCAVVCFPIFVLGQTTVRSKYLSLLI